MWKIVKLELNNFMSHCNSVIEFNDSKATMVDGINKTDKGQISNGSGKSAILEGLAVSILGEPLKKSRDIGTKDLIRRGHKLCEVQIQLHDGSNTLVINRKFYNNTKPSEVDLMYNQLPPEGVIRNGQDKYDVRDANKYILQQLDISKEDLINYFFVSKKQFKSFFSANDNDKKAVIGRFSKSNLIDPIFDQIKLDINQIEKSNDEIDTSISELQGKISAYQEQIDQYDGDLIHKNNQIKLTNLQAEIANKNQSKQQLQKLETQQQKSIDLYNNRLDNLPKITINVDDKVKLRKTYNSELTQYQNEVNQLIRQRNSIETLLLGKIECPQCKHLWVPKNDKSIQQLNKELSIKNTNIKEAELDVNDVNQDINDVQKDIDVYQNKTDQRARIEKSIKEALSKININSTKYQIKEIDTAIQSFNNQINIIKKPLVDPTIEWQQKIDESKQLITQHNQSIESNNDKIFQHKEWIGNFTKFKTHLSNKTIGVIQAHCNEFLLRMNSNIQIQMDGYKINKSGDIRESISTKVIKDNIDYGSVGNLSGGEEARVIISAILTQQKLINDNCNGGLDLCFLDEVIESVDSAGVLGIMNTLNLLNQTIVVITHATFDHDYPHTLTVSKINNKSIVT